MALSILHEDKNILVAIKPQGVPSQPDKTGDMDMTTMVADHLKTTVKNPFVGLVHRLDRPVGGVMVFAKNEKTLQELNRQLAAGAFQKKYKAVVCGIADATATLEDHLIKNQRLNLSKVVHKNTPGAKYAKLEYACVSHIPLSPYGSLSILEVVLLTGRHHQIRVQLSHHGLPIWGDTKYNKQFERITDFVNIALWSVAISFPYKGTQVSFSYTPEEMVFSK